MPTSEAGSRLRGHEYQKGSAACRENQMILTVGVARSPEPFQATEPSASGRATPATGAPRGGTAPSARRQGCRGGSGGGGGVGGGGPAGGPPPGPRGGGGT